MVQPTKFTFVEAAEQIADGQQAVRGALQESGQAQGSHLDGCRAVKGGRVGARKGAGGGAEGWAGKARAATSTGAGQRQPGEGWADTASPWHPALGWVPSAKAAQRLALKRCRPTCKALPLGVVCRLYGLQEHAHAGIAHPLILVLVRSYQHCKARGPGNSPSTALRGVRVAQK